MPSNRYSLSTLRRLANPGGIRGVIRHIGTTLNQRYFERFGEQMGSNFIREDWDNLIILDGCRFDLFQEVCELNGSSESRRSMASDSNGFIQANFVGETLHDTVYISGNPYTASIPDGTFHYVNNLSGDGWDEDLGTVPPKVVSEATREAAATFPNKRIIAHFMQPHYPFIGELGREMDSGRIEPNRTNAVFGHTIWQKLQYGLTDLSHKGVWKAYRENLEVVLSVVEGLIDGLTGKTVITADHGNLIGDRLFPFPVRGYGHPPDLFVEPLVKVPWFVIGGDRREVQSDEPVTFEQLDDDQVQDRLRALGYK